MKCPSLQSCKLSRPTNQSGEGTIFVIADTCDDEDGGGGDDHDQDGGGGDDHDEDGAGGDTCDEDGDGGDDHDEDDGGGVHRGLPIIILSNMSFNTFN